jgi:hypothetical protein
MHSVAVIQRQHTTQGDGWTHTDSMPALAWGDELIKSPTWVYGYGQGDSKESAIRALRRDLVKKGQTFYMYLLDGKPTRFDHID